MRYTERYVLYVHSHHGNMISTLKSNDHLILSSLRPEQVIYSVIINSREFCSLHQAYESSIYINKNISQLSHLGSLHLIGELHFTRSRLIGQLQGKNKLKGQSVAWYYVSSNQCTFIITEAGKIYLSQTFWLLGWQCSSTIITSRFCSQSSFSILVVEVCEIIKKKRKRK